MVDRAHTVKPGDASETPKSVQPPRTAVAINVGLAVLAVAELAWLAWFLIVPLPNANNVGTPAARAVRRGWMLLKAFPEVIPETTFRESFLGNGLKQLSHVENLPQRLPIILTAGLIAAAAIGLGATWRCAALKFASRAGGTCRANRTRLWPGRWSAWRRYPAVGPAGLARSAIVSSRPWVALADRRPGDGAAMARVADSS